MLLKNCLCGGTKKCEICGVDASYECKDYDQKFCEGCCHKVHQHSKWSHHLPQKLNLEFVDDSGIEITHVGAERNSDTTAAVCSNIEYCGNDDYFNDEEVFVQAMMIATLAEKFGMTEFKDFQKETIQNSLAKKDCLVIQPTGSGKSHFQQYTKGK